MTKNLKGKPPRKSFAASMVMSAWAWAKLSFPASPNSLAKNRAMVRDSLRTAPSYSRTGILPNGVSEKKTERYENNADR